MAKKTTQQVRVNTTRYLDEDGLQVLWESIKEYVSDTTITMETLEEALTKIETDYTNTEELVEMLLQYASIEHTHTLSEIEDYVAPDLTPYATTDYVITAINNAQLSGDGSSVDLSIYATKTELSNKADADHTHEGYATTEYVDNAISNIEVSGDNVDLTGYVKTEDMTAALETKADKDHTHDYATTDYVDTAIENIEITGGGSDVYYGTEAPTNGETLWINPIGEPGNVNNGLTEADVNALIDAKLGVIENGTY